MCRRHGRWPKARAAILRHLLASADPRLDPLRRQIDVAMVTGMCSCGCPSVDLEVDPRLAEPAPGLPSPVIDA